MNHSNDIFHQIFDLCAVGLAHITLDARFLNTNRHLQELLGYSAEEFLEKDFAALLHEEDPAFNLSDSDYTFQSQRKMNRLRHYSGHYIWVNLTISALERSSEALSFVVSIQDASDLKQAEETIQSNEARFKTILDSISDEVSVYVLTPDYKDIVYVNQGYERIWGMTGEQVIEEPRQVLDLIHPDDRNRVREHLKQNRRGDWNLDYRIIRLDGQQRYLHDVGNPIYDRGELQFVVGLTMDRTNITEQQMMLDNSLQRLREAYDQLAEAARRDGLTGILNRAAIINCIERAYESFCRYGTPATLVFIDLNRFKDINDSFGHMIGDQTLVALVDHLKRNIRQTDDISRYGGDEFVVLLNNATKRQAQEFCNRVGPTVALTLPNQNTIQASMSFGISEISDDIRDTEHWISEADLLMYGDKAQSMQ